MNVKIPAAPIRLPGRLTLSSTGGGRLARSAAGVALILLTAWLTVPAAFPRTGFAQAADKLRYNRDIRPILADKCFACHGPDSASRQADLRLDQRDVAIDMGAIAPGSPDESLLVERIASDDPDLMMPPPESKKSLTDEEKRRLTEWIEQGAEYQLHWSFIPARRPAVPDASKLEDGRHADWPRNAIDHFVLEGMLKQGLEPTKPAERRALARRLSLDLTGLPPEPELVEGFVADRSEDAYETLVDKLLDSVHWGEHRGRYWLDCARYADTHGLHFDNYREMWSYRDWVIDAFNRNMPFDRFTIENLAGDLLPDASLDQRIASGFNRCNMTTNEGGIIDEEYLVLYTRDRTETTSQVWMGLTAGCAVCHSHKFDPLSQREFYELAAFFNNTTQGARDGNVKDTPPIITVPRDSDRDLWNRTREKLDGATDRRDRRRERGRDDFERWLRTATVESIAASLPRDVPHLRAPLDEGTGDRAEIEVDGAARSVPVDPASWQSGTEDKDPNGKDPNGKDPNGKDPNGKGLAVQGGVCELSDVGRLRGDEPITCSAWVKVPANDGQGALCARMDNKNKYRGWDFWIQRRQFGAHVIHAWPENAVKVVSRAQLPADRWAHVAFTYDGSRKAAGVSVYYDGRRQETDVENDTLTGAIETDVPLRIGQRDSSDPFTGALRDLRIYRRALSAEEVASLARAGRFASVLEQTAERRSRQDIDALYDFWLGALDPTYRDAAAEVHRLEHQLDSIKTRATIAHVMREKDERPTAYLLNRGEYDQRRDQLTADTPDVFPAFPEDVSRDRLGFARWLLLPDHPLTARVTVNRFWQQVFGTGIVSTTGDFGVMGDLPSHPELLDWLAVEFRESGWDVKRLFKLMVMSSTYRQSSSVTRKALEIDPHNRFLSRGPRFRMDAEMVRDHALAASGLLVREVGGPSVKPYQPPGVWEAIAMNVSNTKSYEQGTGNDLYRRSLYTFIKRMAPPASMEIFNAPNREFCVVQRERTNTPLQALVTLNDEQFVEAARHLAQRALLEGGESFDRRLEFVSMRLVARRFDDEERALIKRTLDELSSYYAEHAEDAGKLVSVGQSKSDASLDVGELAAWTMLTNELMNLDEVLNK